MWQLLAQQLGENAWQSLVMPMLAAALGMLIKSLYDWFAARGTRRKEAREELADREKEIRIKLIADQQVEDLVVGLEKLRKMQDKRLKSLHRRLTALEQRMPKPRQPKLE